MVNVPLEEQKSQSHSQSRDTEISMQSGQKFIKTDRRQQFGRKFSKNDDMSEPHGSGTNVACTAENTVIEAAPPIVAIVAPTTRPPPNNNSNTTIKPGNVSCAATTMIPQAQQPTIMHTTYRIGGVPHHHISPIQLNTATLTPQPTMQQASTSGVQIAQVAPNEAVWPMVKPVFHFGPGFELHQSYCPTHSQAGPSEHIVLFHLLPGVAVSFQIGGALKIIRGE